MKHHALIASLMILVSTITSTAAFASTEIELTSCQSPQHRFTFYRTDDASQHSKRIVEVTSSAFSGLLLCYKFDKADEFARCYGDIWNGSGYMTLTAQRIGTPDELSYQFTLRGTYGLGSEIYDDDITCAVSEVED